MTEVKYCRPEVLEEVELVCFGMTESRRFSVLRMAEVGGSRPQEGKSRSLFGKGLDGLVLENLRMGGIRA